MIVIESTLALFIKMLKHIHRKITAEAEYLFLHQIEYVITEEGLVDILKVGLYLVDDDGIIGENLIDDLISNNLPYELRLAALNDLVEDGIISIP